MPIVCNDNNACTIDKCDTVAGCIFTPVVGDDNNACTIDACNSATGVITHTAIVCNDNNACTTEQCVNGGCVTTSTKDCNDNNLCTNDSCNPATGACVNTPKCAAGETCDPAVGTCVLACNGVKTVTIRGGGQKPTGADLQIQPSFTVMNDGCIVDSSVSSVTCTAGTILQVNFRAGYGPNPTSVTWQSKFIPTDTNFMFTCAAGNVYKLVLENKDAVGGQDVDRITINVQ
jgi:hypothetical protein